MLEETSEDKPNPVEKISAIAFFLSCSGILNPLLITVLTPGLANYLGMLVFMVPGFAFLLTRHSGRLDIWQLAPALVFVSYVAISLCWSENAVHGGFRLAGLILVSLWAIYLADRFSVETITKLVITSVTLAGIGSALTALVSPQIGTMSQYLHLGDWNGIYEHKNTLGKLMADGILFSAVYLCIGRGRTVWVLAAAALCLLVLIRSGSRTGMGLAALSPAIFFYAWLKQIRSIGWAMMITLLIGSCVVTWALAMDYEVLERQGETIRVLGVPFDLTGRTLSWQLALDKLSPYWVFGYGYDGFWGEGLTGSDLSPEWRGQQDAHNGFIDVLLQTGIIGELLFVAMLFYYAFRFARSDASAGIFSIAVLVDFITVNLTESIALKATNIGQLLLTLAILINAKRVPEDVRN